MTCSIFSSLMFFLSAIFFRSLSHLVTPCKKCFLPYCLHPCSFSHLLYLVSVLLFHCLAHFLITCKIACFLFTYCILAISPNVSSLFKNNVSFRNSNTYILIYCFFVMHGFHHFLFNLFSFSNLVSFVSSLI